MTPAHLFVALAVAFSAGVTYPIAKYGVAHFPPIFFTNLRYLIVIALLAPWWRIPAGRRRQIFLIAMTMVLQYIFMFTALSRAGDASTMALVHQLYVPFATIIAAIVYREAVGARRWAGLVVAFGGVAVIGFDPVVFSYLDAFFLAMAAALMLGLATVQARRTAGVSVFTMQFWISLYAFLPTLAASMWLEEGQIESLADPGWIAVASVVAAAVLGAVFAQAGRYYLVQRYPVSLVAPIMLLTPVFAVVSSVTMLDDVLTWRIVVGGALVIVGVAAIVLAPSRAGRPRTGSA